MLKTVYPGQCSVLVGCRGMNPVFAAASGISEDRGLRLVDGARGRAAYLDLGRYASAAPWGSPARLG
eukprot:5153759-Lingulodinium_polyedra.AAC.1